MIKGLLNTLVVGVLSFGLQAQVKNVPLYPDSVIDSRIYSVAGIGSSIYIGGLSYLSFVWYKDHQRVPFHFYDDSRGYLQLDKFGHAYAAYWESYSAYQALRWAGVEKKKALIWAGPVGFLFQAPIEVFDGMYEGWGFSWWDIAANTFGSTLFTLQQAFFDEQIILMKFSYSPSGYPKYHDILGENEFQSFFLDYNGHTHWLSVNINKALGLNFTPKWLNFALGYSANGMIHEFDNPTWYRGEPFPELQRYRQLLFSLDIDLTRIPVRKRWVRVLLKTLNTIKVPFPALEINRIDGVRFRPLYF